MWMNFVLNAHNEGTDKRAVFTTIFDKSCNLAELVLHGLISKKSALLRTDWQKDTLIFDTKKSVTLLLLPAFVCAKIKHICINMHFFNEYICIQFAYLIVKTTNWKQLIQTIVLGLCQVDTNSVGIVFARAKAKTKDKPSMYWYSSRYKPYLHYCL